VGWHGRLTALRARVLYRLWGARPPTGASRARQESNRWLRAQAAAMPGRVLSVGSGDDSDGEGGHYRDYFTCCEVYLTSELASSPACDLQLDVRHMPTIADASFDCALCSGVLEHVDAYRAALDELHRILRPGGVLLVGCPFRQALHLEPTDYWRFTEHGVRLLLSDRFRVDELIPIDSSVPGFPAAYWVRAVKL